MPASGGPPGSDTPGDAADEQRADPRDRDERQRADPRDAEEAARAAAALARLDEITRILRRECPWDREQDERSIVPHTVEEAYELAEAAGRQDDAKLLDELGDVLFQVHFLSLLMQERGAGDLARVAEQVTEKLIRRHPHVFGDAAADTAGEVLSNWDQIKKTEAGREPGLFGEVPENLPGPLHARKLQRRAASSGFDPLDTQATIDTLIETAHALQGARRGEDRERRFAELGDLLFAAVNVSRRLHLDPELALRAASTRFRDALQAASDLTASEGGSWDDLAPEQQLTYYARARLNEGEPPPP